MAVRLLLCKAQVNLFRLAVCLIFSKFWLVLFNVLVRAQALTGLPMGLFMAIWMDSVSVEISLGFKGMQQGCSLWAKALFHCSLAFVAFRLWLTSVESKLVVSAVLHLCLDGDILRFFLRQPQF